MNVVLAFPSAFANQALVRAIRAIDARLKIIFEQGFLVCETDDTVELASRLEGIFGIGQVAIARKVKNEFEELSNAIAEVGLKVVLPGEKFAYVCIQVSHGLGGLPLGSLGRALCSLHSPLSFLSCHAVTKAGFVPEIVLLYSDENDLQANARLAEILAKRTSMKCVIRVASMDIPRIKDVAITELVKEAIAAKVLVGLPGNRVALSLTPTIHPLWFIEAITGKVMAAGKTPYMPLMFTDIPEDYAAKMQPAISKSNLQKYSSAIDAAANLSIKKMKKLKVGPNYLHDILDSV